MSISKYFLILGLVVFLGFGIFFRIYALNWGSPFFFNPDERNITSSITNLSFPNQMNPHFFAYGSFPIYSIYFSSFLLNHLQNPPFELVILMSRIYSSLLSIGIFLSLMYIGKKIFSTQTGIIAGMLAAFSTGFIQYAHFGTFEMWLAFFSLWFFYTWYIFHRTHSVKGVVLLGILSGILLGTKVSSVVLLIFPIFSIFLYFFRKKRIIHFFLLLFMYSALTASVFLFTNPFAIIDSSSFLGSIHYESSVAIGTLPVFYTQGFTGTTPVLFQLFHVYPFLLNPFVTIGFLIAVFVLPFRRIQAVKKELMICFFFLVLFLSQAFFFVKWNRYMVITMPYIYLLLASFISPLSKYIRAFTMLFLCIVSIIYSIAYVQTAFFTGDSRLLAAAWANQHIPSGARILTEPYDLGATPFQSIFPQMKDLPLYDIDNNVQLTKQLAQRLSTTDVVLLPSQRLYRSRLQQPQTFPVGHTLYQALQNGKLGFKKVYQTPCDILCKIDLFGNPIFSYEETATVFDHPTVIIFKKEKQFSESDYLKLLQQ